MRHYFKPAVIATLLLLAVFAPQGAAYCQSGATSGGHFDWVKGYGTSASYGCYIRGSVTDSLGNLYILGEFRNDSEWGTGWDSERLLPMVPYGPWADNVNVIIAKISSEGEMVWKKVIHANNGISTTSYDIKKVGDTAFACLVDITLPTEDHYLYYLDTLIPGRSDYPVKSMYVDFPVRTAFIMFDFEGNVIEQHFLYVTYTDTAGNDFVSYYNPNIDSTPWLTNWSFQYASFDIDNYGNIFISRESNDHLFDSVNAENGTIRGIKFWVDSNIVGQCPVENKPQRWYPQILKFSPHFDTLLSSRYVVQKSTDSVYFETVNNRTVVDNDGNVYFRSYYQGVFGNPEITSDTIIFDSLQNKIVNVPKLNFIFSFLVRYDSFLNFQWLITLDDSIVSVSNDIGSQKSFYDMTFDKDSNLLFLSAHISKTAYTDTSSVFYILTYQGTPLLSLKNDVFFMAFKNDSILPRLYSYGRVPSIMNYSLAVSLSMGNLVCKNNRVFMQSLYLGGLRLPTGDVRFNNKYDSGLGLTIFDYQGRLIGGYDYQAISSSNCPGSISLCDSILYLSGVVFSDATFGNIQLDKNGFSLYAYIAKYVDTSFMTPYVRPTINRMATPVDEALLLYPNPASGKTSINAIDEPILEISALSMSGAKALVPFRGNTIDTESLQPGIYILEIVTLHNKYHHKFIKL